MNDVHIKIQFDTGSKSLLMYNSTCRVGFHPLTVDGWSIIRLNLTPSNPLFRVLPRSSLGHNQLDNFVFETMQ